jgi:hypothetical protein
MPKRENVLSGIDVAVVSGTALPLVIATAVAVGKMSMQIQLDLT